MSTAAGRLDKYVCLEGITGKTQDSQGSIKPVWTPIDEMYCEIKPLHGRNIEIALARTKGKSVSHQITLHYNQLVKETTTRFNYEGRLFEIFSVVDVLERHIDLDVLANEIEA